LAHATNIAQREGHKDEITIPTIVLAASYFPRMVQARSMSIRRLGAYRTTTNIAFAQPNSPRKAGGLVKRLKFSKPFEMSEQNFGLMKEALTHLSPKQRLIIYLRFWDNMTIQEIARYVGHSWTSTDMMIDSAIHHMRVRIIQLSHAREEAELLQEFLPLAA
jgi:DNA-directed RNA polymerase specialized sigma24 family protein